MSYTETAAFTRDGLLITLARTESDTGVGWYEEPCLSPPKSRSSPCAAR